MKRKCLWFLLGVLLVMQRGWAIIPVRAVLHDIDSGTTSPAGNYRWMDTADQLYAGAYQASYDYTLADVQADFYSRSSTFFGRIMASNLKPNFTYQLKLVGDPEMDAAANERLGLTGRWWQEEWDAGTGTWINGRNLNNKGDGSSPNPNDQVYFSLRDAVDASSPTGRKYRFTAYRVIDYFITDSRGNALLSFEADSSYHVLFKTTQRSHTANDGPVRIAVFDADVAEPAYDIDYEPASVEVFGEWERLPTGGIYLPPGVYQADLMLTEESFHGSGLAGGWAAAMGSTVKFTILTQSEVCLYSLAGDLNDDCRVSLEDLAVLAQHWLIDCRSESLPPDCMAVN